MKLEFKEAIKLEEGKHEGKISKVENRIAGEEDYEYVDIFIDVKGKDVTLKYGCPANLSTNSRLGKLMALFTTLSKGDKYDPKDVLMGKAVSFMTMNKEKKQGIFAEVVEGSIKPLEGAK